MLTIHDLKEVMFQYTEPLIRIDYGEEDEWKIIINRETVTQLISGAYCEPTNDPKQLIDFRNYVFNIIKSKSENKSLPESNGGYQ